MGRPSKFETHIKPHFDDIKKAFDRGVEEKEIAKNLGITISTWCDYKNKYSECAELLKRDDNTTSERLKRLDSSLLKIADVF